MRVSRCTVLLGLLLGGCPFRQASLPDDPVPGVGDDGGSGSSGGGDETGTLETDGGDDPGDESGIADDGDEGCVDASECPPGDTCVGGLCVGDMCPDGEVCEPTAVCRTGEIDCSSGTAECVVVGNAPAGTVCGAGYICDIAGDCVSCVDGAECQPQAECSLGKIACGDGDPICTPDEWAAEGTPCSGDRYCNETGVCVAALDCATIQTFDATVVSGVYPIDPDGPGGNAPMDVFCDFDTGGGAWSLWDSADVDMLPSNAEMPRCDGMMSTDCFAGTYAGRGDAPGLFRVTAITEHLESDLGWSAVTVDQEHLGDCNVAGSTCTDGDDRCLFSMIGEGIDCCTAGNMNNVCLQ